jgi:hypothetical protein
MYIVRTVVHKGLFTATMIFVSLCAARCRTTSHYIKQQAHRRSLVRIPPGCKVFRNLYIAVLLSQLNMHFHCAYLRKINDLKNNKATGDTQIGLVPILRDIARCRVLHDNLSLRVGKYPLKFSCSVSAAPGINAFRTSPRSTHQLPLRGDDGQKVFLKICFSGVTNRRPRCQQRSMVTTEWRDALSNHRLSGKKQLRDHNCQVLRLSYCSVGKGGL